MRNEIDSEESIEDINCKNIFLNFLAQKSNDKNSLPSFNSIKSIRIKNTSFEKININNSRKRLSLINKILNFDFLRRNSYIEKNINKNVNNMFYVEKNEEVNRNYKKKYENNQNENYEEFENDNINFRRAE